MAIPSVNITKGCRFDNVVAPLFQYHSLGTGERYGPTAQHKQDSPIFFIQLNYVHNDKNNVLLPYGKFPCHKVAQHWEFHFFLNSAILHSWNSDHSCLYLLKSPSILAIHQFFCCIVLVCICRYAFRHILGFLPSFSVLSWETCFIINMFSQMADFFP